MQGTAQHSYLWLQYYCHQSALKLSARVVVITEMIASLDCCCLPRAKEAMWVRGRPIARSQQEGIEEPEWNSQQVDEPDAAKEKDKVDYNLDVPVTQNKREVVPDDEYETMELPSSESLHQRMMSQEV